MSEVNDLAVAAGSSDVRTGLRAALALRRLAERLEALQVANARRQGWSWQEIAEALEVSKQAVHQKHAARAAAVQSPASDPAASHAGASHAGASHAGASHAGASHAGTSAASDPAEPNEPSSAGPADRHGRASSV